jgi:hypothetical protein
MKSDKKDYKLGRAGCRQPKKSLVLATVQQKAAESSTAFLALVNGTEGTGSIVTFELRDQGEAATLRFEWYPSVLSPHFARNIN